MLQRHGFLYAGVGDAQLVTRLGLVVIAPLVDQLGLHCISLLQRLNAVWAGHWITRRRILPRRE